jgi:hypothetical protein
MKVLFRYRSLHLKSGGGSDGIVWRRTWTVHESPGFILPRILEDDRARMMNGERDRMEVD